MWGDDELHSDDSTEENIRENGENGFAEDVEDDSDGANSEHNEGNEDRNEATVSSQEHMIQRRERRKPIKYL